MEKITKEEKENTLKNFLIILGIMTIIYLLSFFSWQRYEMHLKNKIHYPYVQLRDSGYKTVKNYPYTFKNTTIKIIETLKKDIYEVQTRNGSDEIKTFDSRYFVFENDDFSVIAYPSYEYRGLEYMVFSKKEKIKFVVIPTEDKLNDIFEILKVLDGDIKTKTNINDENLIKIGENIGVKYEDETYIIPDKVLNIIKSKNYYYFYVVEDEFKKVYVANKTQEKIYEILLLKSNKK